VFLRVGNVFFVVVMDYKFIMAPKGGREKKFRSALALWDYSAARMRKCEEKKRINGGTLHYVPLLS
jgi:hypothetical protein